MKGVVVWPDTQVGRRRAVLCPYSVEYAIYVSRDCVIDVDPENTAAVWNDFDQEILENSCPYPPFTNALKGISKAVGI